MDSLLLLDLDLHKNPRNIFLHRQDLVNYPFDKLPNAQWEIALALGGHQLDYYCLMMKNTEYKQSMIDRITNVHSKQMYIQKFSFKMNVHSKQMYIQNVCTFKMNVHHWSCLPHFEYYCHTVAMFATFWLWLPLCGHVCHILIMIAILWPRLPRFDYDCHTLGMFATFWAWLPYCSHVCHILSIIAALWPCFNYDCHTVSMIVVNCNVHLLQSVPFWIYFQRMYIQECSFW